MTAPVWIPAEAGSANTKNLCAQGALFSGSARVPRAVLGVPPRTSEDSPRRRNRPVGRVRSPGISTSASTHLPSTAHPKGESPSPPPRRPSARPPACQVKAPPKSAQNPRSKSAHLRLPESAGKLRPPRRPSRARIRATIHGRKIPQIQETTEPEQPAGNIEPPIFTHLRQAPAPRPAASTPAPRRLGEARTHPTAAPRLRKLAKISVPPGSCFPSSRSHHSPRPSLHALRPSLHTSARPSPRTTLAAFRIPYPTPAAARNRSTTSALRSLSSSPNAGARPAKIAPAKSSTSAR
ncbi:MAG: hypothetical protein RLZZ15_2787 [Verrucomicrobiota bacterium]